MEADLGQRFVFLRLLSTVTGPTEGWIDLGGKCVQGVKEAKARCLDRVRPLSDLPLETRNHLRKPLPQLEVSSS